MSVKSAAGDTVESENGIRFVQVAAGEDFAIGLTFDGELYGWSLTGNTTSDPTQDNLNVTLGDYYTATPTKIDVKFIQGPGSIGMHWDNKLYGEDGQVLSGTVEPDDFYHRELDDGADKIKKIVATRTTAAFITENGYIYTWGKDTVNQKSAEGIFIGDFISNPNYLLYREVSAKYPWYAPYMIDYYYYDNNKDPICHAIPNDNTVETSFTDIAAGEYNYILLYRKGNNAYSYVWGSLLYNNINTLPLTSYDYMSSHTGNADTALKGGLNNVRHRIDLGPVSQNGSISVVAGGYNVGFNTGSASGTLTSLQLRGRNFLTSQYDKANQRYKLTMTIAGSATSNITYEQNNVTANVTGGIAGGQTSTGTPDDMLYKGIVLNSYYGVLSGGASSRIFANSSYTNILNAHGGSLASYKTQNNDDVQYAKAVLSGVSLGNDVGYGIVYQQGLSYGRLFGWGDNAQGQLGKTAGGSDATPIQITNSANFVSVAAGKQLSSISKPLYDTESLDIAGGTISGFRADELDEDGRVERAGVRNGVDFITGAVTNDGELFVWSNKNTTPKEIKYGNATSVQDPDKFVAVYSGYGNNLFAITKVGKLVRIQYSGTDYTQYRYDTFNDGTDNIENWGVDSTNVISFAPTVTEEDEDEVVSPDLGKATFYVWGVDVVGKTEENPKLGTVTVNGSGNEYKTLVNNNAIGDVYRILGVSGDDTKLSGRFLSDPDNDGGATSFKPVFKYGKGTNYDNYTVMTDVQQQNMFTAGIVNTAGKGVGIEITPKKSSKGYDIVMDFYVARYNAAASFTTENDNALYYDYKKCSIRFNIADTPAVKTFDAFGEDGNSNIPLLDPNNEYNKYYSVAVQNVSKGFEALATYFGNSNLTESIIGSVSLLDKGFPAVSKITDGDLTYYLGSTVAAAKYNGKYQYLFDDRDSDRITIGVEVGTTMMEGASTNGAVTGAIDRVTVAVDTGLVTDDVSVETVAGKFASDFDNVYGLYNVQFSATENKIFIGFTYDIMRFEAISSSGALSYKETNGVADYLTTDNSDARVSASVIASSYTTGFSIGYATTGTARNLPSDDTRRIVAVYSQPSLRVSKNSYGETPEGFKLVSGKSGANNYTQVFTMHPNDADIPFVVGDEATIDLSKFFASRSNKMVFTYQNKASSQAYTDFNNTFFDGTGGGTQIAELTGTTLTVRPTIAEPLSIEVVATRFASADDNSAAFAGGNERIVMTFVFRNIADFSLTETDHSNTFLVTKNETIDVIANGFINVDNVEGGSGITSSKKEQLLRKLVITEPQYAATSVFTATKTSATAISIVPKASGSGVVAFSATLYGKSISFEITVNVRKVTLFNDSGDLITIVNDQYLYIDTIKSKLAESNEFEGSSIDDYNVLTNDVADPAVKNDNDKVSYRAIYFTDEPTGDAIERPSFIRNVVFEGVSTEKPNIRIIANNSSVASNKDYYMHVRFTNAKVDTYSAAPDGTVIEAVYIVRSGKIKVNTSINIDCKDISNSSSTSGGITLTTTGTGMDAVITFPVSQLLELAKTESPQQYSIVIIRADSTTANYFNYSAVNNNKDIQLTLVDNTPNITDPENNLYGPELEVSVSNGSAYLILTFNVSVSGILTKLPVMQEDGVIGYGNIWIYSFIIVFGVLAIIFIIRMIVYWKKRAKQRAIIKRNQELIRMRDRIHAKGTAATREQMVKTKLKMNDPKYAKLMNEMRKNRQEENGGVVLENSDIASTTIDTKNKKNKKKKKGGKKTVAELKAELEAKKAAFAAAQAQSARPVNPFEQGPMDGGDFGAGGDFVTPEADFVSPDGGFGGAADDFGGAQSIDGGEIIFDATDIGDGM